MPLRDVDVVLPASVDEAVAAFGDGDGVTVIGGGTIVMPELVAGRLRPRRALLLGRAGLDGVSREGGRVTIGAATPVSALEDGDEPLATAARHLADLEVRAQATVGGNLCAEASPDAPRGDLQAALIALGATVRSTGSGGERTEPVEEFLGDGGGEARSVAGKAGDARPENRGAHGAPRRLVLDVSYDDVPRETGYAAARRPHTHHYTILAVAAARRDGELRVAATGIGPRAVRLSTVERGGSVETLPVRDDALASGWYRARILPRLVERALAMVDGAEHA